jgi:hypothetical protein
MSRTRTRPGLTRNQLVALLLAALLTGACAGVPEPQALPAPEFRAGGAGAEPGPGKVLDVGATTVARSPSGRVRLATLSSRAGLVTGGDALVEITVEGATAPVLAVNDRAVTGLADPDTEGRVRHLLTGLPAHAIVNASVGEDLVDEAALKVENHPAEGPLFAGARTEPFVCKNETAGLAPAADAACSAPTVTTWSYRALDGEFHDLAEPNRIPPDIATVAIGGRMLPYIVRDERGVIDRSIYRLVVLDPHPGDGPTPMWDPSGWNGRLVHRFGGGCGSTYGNNAGNGYNTDPQSPYLLDHGYAVIASTLTTFQATCNPTLSAEVTARLREHFIEHYGVPAFVIGDGGSGGAIQQLHIAQNYPGLLDAITPRAPFPDAVSIMPGVTDCGLLMELRARPDGPDLTEAQWAAVSGFATMTTCMVWKATYLEGIRPGDGCDPALADQVYEPLTRPDGVRCTHADSNVNVYGRDPATGFARRPLDNTGVAYGLAALRTGTIEVDQFLDLNERIGGYDIDGQIVPVRTRADEEAVAAAYRSGGAISDPRPLGEVPIILINEYADDTGDLHDSFRAFSLRQRLSDAGLPGTNVAVWTARKNALSPDPAAVVVADNWLTGAAAAPADRPWADRLEAARPELAVDTCELAAETVRGDRVYDPGSACRRELPHHGDPRTAAGAPLRNDILVCARRPVDDRAVSELGIALSAGQRERLARVFPDGLCDWSRPGPGHAPWGGPWQRY